MEINYLAVLLAAIASMVIGAWWYSPAGFGDAWIKEMGFSKEDIRKVRQSEMMKSYVLMFLSSLITAYILAHVAFMSEALELGNGMSSAIFMWLGFMFPIILGGVLWDGRSWKHFCITGGYWLVMLVAMRAILTYWP